LEEVEEPVSAETLREQAGTEEVIPEEVPITEFIAALEKNEEPVSEETLHEEPESEETASVEEPVAEVVTIAEEGQASESAQEVEERAEEVPAKPTISAYDEFLEDNNEPININVTKNQLEDTQITSTESTEVEVTTSDVNMDIKNTVDVDTENAHVWNELGNVYFNAGSYDDAIAAYSKAIELDEQFAWPYTNLALSYAQKGNLNDAILLYQRSIELFSNEREKAVTWNRLGNVYRRLDDYENAIAAYQRADELDPGNTAITQQSQYSLLGSENVSEEVGYSL
jgi:tetratricopeptide (TPR) repeat protein